MASLKEVIAIIRPDHWQETKARLQRLPAFTHQRVLGRGRARGLRYLSRKGATTGVGVQYLPKRMISWVVEETHVASLIQTLIDTNQTGQLGDGKIFVLPIEGALRIRTGERDVDAVHTQEPFEMVRGVSHVTSTVELEHASRQ